MAADGPEPTVPPAAAAEPDVAAAYVGGGGGAAAAPLAEEEEMAQQLQRGEPAWPAAAARAAALGCGQMKAQAEAVPAAHAGPEQGR